MIKSIIRGNVININVTGQCIELCKVRVSTTQVYIRIGSINEGIKISD